MKFIRYLFAELGSGLRDFWVGFPKFVKRNWKTIRKYLIFWLVVIAVFVGLYFILPIKMVIFYWMSLGMLAIGFIPYAFAIHAELEDGMMYSWSKEGLKYVLLFVTVFLTIMAVMCFIDSFYKA